MSSNVPDVGPSFIVSSTLQDEHNLTSLVELVYVRVGNEVMAQALSKLETALDATKQSLSALTDLQGLHNQIAVGSKSAIPFDFKASTQTITYNSTFLVGTKTITFTTTRLINSEDSYVSGYNQVASAYYTPIVPYFAVSIPGATSAVQITAKTSSQLTPAMLSAFNYFKTQLFQSKANISGLIAQLTPITPANDPTTLLAKLKTVYSEFPTGSSYLSVRAWALDGYTIVGSSAVIKAGTIQQHITNAITAGESLNSSQNAAVRRYMFVFEQYYQSAAAIISSLNQMMQSMARKISG
ncbi:MAG: hypothetical protein ACXV2C_00815 [Candidatus Bathyarchaeia archaeon]